MKTTETMKKTTAYLLVVLGVAAVTQWALAADENAKKEEKTVRVIVAGGSDDSNTSHSGKMQKTIVVKGVEPVVVTTHSGRKELPWLGVATDEATEVVTAQLGLEPGVGLVVNYVATNSPAAKAGLQKNDVLVEFENQALVLPAQLRKLVQARKEGDTVKLVYYRAGKKETTTATLGKTSASFGLLGDEHSWGGDLKQLQLQLRELPIGDTIREQMEVVRKSLGDAKLDQKKIQVEIERSVEQARKAVREALKEKSNADASTDAAAKALKELEHLNVDLDKNTTVTIRNSGKTVKNVVKADESGTIAILSNPKLHLTAHDKDGKLVFDGEIETEEQRAKVPPEIWKQAEPLLEKLKADGPKEEQEEVEKDTRSTQIPAPRGGSDFVLSAGLLGGTRML
jgi:C-terminal processing protease CtpA/Prc